MRDRLALELFMASVNGALPKVEALLHANGHLVDGAVHSPAEITPLMAAAANGHAAVVKLLVEHGADVSLRDIQGHTAADWARLEGHPALAAYLDGTGPLPTI